MTGLEAEWRRWLPSVVMLNRSEGGFILSRIYKPVINACRSKGVRAPLLTPPPCVIWQRATWWFSGQAGGTKINHLDRKAESLLHPEIQCVLNPSKFNQDTRIHKNRRLQADLVQVYKMFLSFRFYLTIFIFTDQEKLIQETEYLGLKSIMKQQTQQRPQCLGLISIN